MIPGDPAMLTLAPTATLLGKLVLLSESEESNPRMRLHVVADCERCWSQHWAPWPIAHELDDTITRQTGCGELVIALDPRNRKRDAEILAAHRRELNRA
jgi:hypothetical protein